MSDYYFKHYDFTNIYEYHTVYKLQIKLNHKFVYIQKHYGVSSYRSWEIYIMGRLSIDFTFFASKYHFQKFFIICDNIF